MIVLQTLNFPVYQQGSLNIYILYLSIPTWAKLKIDYYQHWRKNEKILNGKFHFFCSVKLPAKTPFHLELEIFEQNSLGKQLISTEYFGTHLPIQEMLLDLVWSFLNFCCWYLILCLMILISDLLYRLMYGFLQIYCLMSLWIFGCD